MRMDRNHNQAVIRRLARRSRDKNRARNLFACIAITLSAALIFGFLLYLDGTQTQKLRLQARSTHVTFESITLSQLEQLRQHSGVTWAGGELIVGSRKTVPSGCPLNGLTGRTSRVTGFPAPEHSRRAKRTLCSHRNTWIC